LKKKQDKFLFNHRQHGALAHSAYTPVPYCVIFYRNNALHDWRHNEHNATNHPVISEPDGSMSALGLPFCSFKTHCNFIMFHRSACNKILSCQIYNLGVCFCFRLSIVINRATTLASNRLQTCFKPPEASFITAKLKERKAKGQKFTQPCATR